MPAHCQIGYNKVVNTYIDALSMWGQLCCLETMLKARHLPLEEEMVTTCKEICHRLMEQGAR